MNQTARKRYLPRFKNAEQRKDLLTVDKLTIQIPVLKTSGHFIKEIAVPVHPSMGTI